MTENGFDKEKIDRYFHGEYSEAEASFIAEVFGDAHNEKELNKLLSRQFEDLSSGDDLEEKNLDHILYRIHYDINKRLSDKKVTLFDNIARWSLRIAGVVMLPLLIIMGVRMFNESGIKNDTWVEIKAPGYTRAQFILPDGTKGWLNSNSSVRYNGNFTSDRKVTLTGEAFFDVYKDKKRPFRVNTNEVMVTVLGTRFNIASYENEKGVEVVLEEGKLIFSNKEMKKSVTMNPNDLIVYDKTQKDFTKEVVEPQKYLSWTEGKLIFRNDPVDVIARRLERWYNVDVEVAGSFAGKLRLRATFVNEGLEEVLGLLKHSLPLDYKIDYGVLNPDDTYTKTKVTILPRSN